MRLAAEQKKPIILITDDRKIDWWWKIKDGRNMGPRQELVEEIYKVAKVDFHMYSSERFLSYGQEFHKEKINKKALEEIKEMKRAEIEEFERIKQIHTIKRKREEIDLRTREELRYIESRINKLTKRIESQRNHMHHLELEASENPEVGEYLHNQSIQLSDLMREREMLHMKLKSLEEEHMKLSKYSYRKFFGGKENN